MEEFYQYQGDPEEHLVSLNKITVDDPDLQTNNITIVTAVGEPVYMHTFCTWIL